MLMTKTSFHTRGALALLAAAAIYASFGLLIREIAKMFGDNAQVVARFAVALLILLVIQLVMKHSLRVSKKDLLKVVALGVATGLVVLLFTVSVLNTKIANSVFLLYAGTIATSLVLGTFLLKEKLTYAKGVAIGLALIGLAMYSEAFFALSLGAVTGVLSGFFDGISNALRKMLGKIPRNTVMVYQFAIGTLVCLVAMLASGEQPIHDVSFWPIVATVVFGILQVFLNNFLLYGFQHFDVNVGSIILSLEIVFVSILAFVFLAETPAVHELIGGALIFVASILTVVDFKALRAQFGGAKVK